MAEPIEISLERELLVRATERAEQRGLTLAEYIAQLVALDARPRKPRGDVSRIIGLGDSGGTNIARDKDRLLAEAIAADKIR